MAACKGIEIHLFAGQLPVNTIHQIQLGLKNMAR